MRGSRKAFAEAIGRATGVRPRASMECGHGAHWSRMRGGGSAPNLRAPELPYSFSLLMLAPSPDSFLSIAS